MRKLAAVFLFALAACSGPNEHDYCDGFGIPRTDPEYARCINYYFDQEAAFNNDRFGCDLEADKTYPPSLYSRPTHYVVHGGFGPYGHYGSQIVHTGADYQLNAQVDALRMRIVEPCMQAKGWNSGATWQAGRKLGNKPMKAPSSSLPWLKK